MTARHGQSNGSGAARVKVWVTGANFKEMGKGYEDRVESVQFRNQHATLAAHAVGEVEVSDVSLFTPGGQPLGASPTHDPYSSRLVLGAFGVGNASVKYRTYFKRYAIQPPYISGQRIVAWARCGPAVTSLVLRFEEYKPNVDRAVLWRVLSDYVADRTGAWELPPGWPDTATYPSYPPEVKPSQRGWQQLSRPHEVGTVDQYGNVTYDRVQVGLERPYNDGAVPFEPIKRLEKPSPGPGWESLFLDVN
jgi:hypothetical protein